MIKPRNDCVGCKDGGLPCLGNACPHRQGKVLICDKCRYEAERLYIVDGEELCEECLLKNFETIEE